MKVSIYRSTMRAAALVGVAAFASAALAQTAGTAISLGSEPHALSVAPVTGEDFFANAPDNFRTFPSAQVGVSAAAQVLTLRFAAATQLTRIDSTADFQVEEGGSCALETVYSPGASCTLLVRFTPQGPGSRLGKLTVTHTASASPFAIGLGGNGYAPVVSFTPALITTVPGTFPAGVGLLSSAQNLTVDGGDTLYMADSGNKVIRYMDSSGVIRTLTTTATAPRGIAVDNFGEVYFDEPSANTMHEIYDYGPVVQVNGTGTASCPAATPCNLNSEALGAPGTMSIDAYNHLFFADSHQGAAMATVQPVPAKLIFLYDPFPFQTNPSNPIAADASDNIYSLWYNGSVCEIVRSTLYDAENTNVIFTKIVGGHTCGYSGDGGPAGNAEMGSTVGQMAFDIAGNFYFSDTSNQRVRRIDAVTGIISTIAGTGTAGYTGDGGPATFANLSSPTGVAVDSQGQVYIISSATTGQIIRKLGPAGKLPSGSQKAGTTSAAHTVIVANTGNSALTITKAVITGPNAAEFTIDPNTTSCNLSAGGVLYSGQSCEVGIFFTPAATGARSATLTLLDNTVTNSNAVVLTGTGLSAAALTIVSPQAAQSVASGAPLTFSVAVTSTSSPVPSGTVKLSMDGKEIGGPVALSSGLASVRVTAATTGKHTLSATYSGDGHYAHAGPVTQSISVTGGVSSPVQAQ